MQHFDENTQIWSIYCIETSCSETELRELSVGFAGPVFLRLDLSLLFKGSDKFSLGPTSHLGKITEDAEVSVRLHSEDLKGIWDNHSLLLVVWTWDTFEDLQFLESGPM